MLTPSLTPGSRTRLQRRQRRRGPREERGALVTQAPAAVSRASDKTDQCVGHSHQNVQRPRNSRRVDNGGRGSTADNEEREASRTQRSFPCNSMSAPAPRRPCLGSGSDRGFRKLPDPTRAPNSSRSRTFANEIRTPVCHLRHSLGETRSQSSAVHVCATTVPHAHGAGGSAFA
jgi:hypothetical protein